MIVWRLRNVPRHGLYLQIAAEDFQRIVYAVDVAALVAVGGVDACADVAVAEVITGALGSFHIGTVVGVDIYRGVGLHFLCRVDQLTDNFVAVRAAGVLGADGDLLLGAA